MAHIGGDSASTSWLRSLTLKAPVYSVVWSKDDEAMSAIFFIQLHRTSIHEPEPVKVGKNKLHVLLQNPIFQSEWDKPLFEVRFDQLLQSATSEAERVRLLAVSSKNALDWLHAIPHQKSWWKNGKCLIWDFTCANTLCKSYVNKASTKVGSAAAGQEDKKVEKYK